ncbi:Citrate synthase (si) [Pseudonocardia sp. Ae168_Ps1]|uniref:citrate/2-methylcitrate synthase n=1 Tax=unclassified Pseudonocardia TaxID=2619320 RepID=UPI00094B4124|nr:MULTISPECIES: citrate/2-methylcitrate synthase [unclassified Pseudonocardia]OLL76183.1 Citrate synthase (si) [Pseudonocardia sp. Ae150A_Ps1]OLL82182.1 Citrate synthase (si) [Pseudonocardia sp. Ae168_Ps1]OLL83703.1 Citrate synthase (si) [Pseudonocardia sp. Ae263_Ps1]OLL90256.1 Citrate synthase (si) [Pseudonocardia sp. Ae356_Ps1]
MTTTERAAVPEVPPGLRGVAVTTTTLGDVRGDEGFYHYRQYSAVELARTRTFVCAWFLATRGRLPDPDERAAFAARIAQRRALPAALSALLPGIAATCGDDLLAGLRAALSVLGPLHGMRPVWDAGPERGADDALTVCAATPTILAALHRLRSGLDPVPPRPDLEPAADWLWMLTGAEPDSGHARAVDAYLVSTLDHGFNASTFTARVVASTGADVASAVAAATGAFSGPLHGGAPDRALEGLDAIDRDAGGSPERWVADRLAAGERIMGFGHAVYRGPDPRTALLREVAERLGGPLPARAADVERRVAATLAELRPDRPLHANVEFYAGVVMAGCGIPRSMFTPTFATSRVVGWCAHVLEQAEQRRLIRPSATYVGPPPPEPVPPR